MICGKVQTLDHVLSSCKVALGQGRYTWRHNRVLESILVTLEEHVGRAKKTPPRSTIAFIKEGEKAPKAAETKNKRNFFDGSLDWRIACDLKGEGKYPSLVMKSGMRPDLVITSQESRRMLIVELTVPFESRICHQHEYKIAKYEDLCATIRREGFSVNFFAVEVGARGFVAESMHRLLGCLGVSNRQRRAAVQRFIKTAEKASHWLWCRRNQTELSTTGHQSDQLVWPHPQRM